MRFVRGKDIIVYENNIKIGFIQKYYKFGLWHYRAIIQKKSGFINGVLYSESDARAFIKKNTEVNNG